MLDTTEATLFCGRRGLPPRLDCVETARRDDEGMCTDMCGLLSAHLRWVG
jgi:hypothetical protein